MNVPCIKDAKTNVVAYAVDMDMLSLFHRGNDLLKRKSRLTLRNDPVPIKKPFKPVRVDLGCRILIGGLHWTLRDDQLYSAASSYGNVSCVHIFETELGSSSGLAIIEFEESSSIASFRAERARAVHRINKGKSIDLYEINGDVSSELNLLSERFGHWTLMNKKLPRLLDRICISINYDPSQTNTIAALTGEAKLPLPGAIKMFLSKRNDI